MPVYKNGEDTYNLPENRVAEFLEKYPNATLIEEEEIVEKPTPLQQESAPVKANGALDNTESLPADTSSELPLSYKVGDDIYNLPNEGRVAELLSKYPDAVPYEDKEKKEIAIIQEEKELSGYESIKNALSNLGEDVENIGEFYTGDSAAMDIASATIANYMFGEQNVQEYIKENEGKDFLGIVDATSGLSSQEEIIGKIAEREKQKAEKKPTLEIIESFKEGEILKGGAAIASSFINAVGSALYGVFTAGTGFVFDYAADNYVNYNKGLAKRKGKSLNQLIKDDEAEVAIPVGIGFLQGWAENTGLRRLIGKETKAKIANNVLNKAFGTKAMNLINASGTEALTEMFQYGAEEFNNKLGETGNSSEAANTFIDSVFSQQGFESGLQGAFGGAGIKGGSMLLASNNSRSPDQTVQIEKELEILAKENRQYNRARSDIVREGIQKNIDASKERLAEIVQENNAKIEKLSDTQINEINSLGDLSLVQADKINKLNQERANGTISQKEYTAAVKGFNTSITNAQNGIHAVMIQKEADVIAKVVGKDDLEVYETIDKFKKAYPSVDAQADGFITKEGKIVINKEQAAKMKAVTVGSHELLHKILRSSFSDQEQKNKIINEFKDNLSNKEFNIIQKRINNNYRYNVFNSEKEYQDALNDKSNRDITEENVLNTIADKNGKFIVEFNENFYNEEYLTAFSDAIGKGEITYNENLFTKLKDSLTNILKEKGFANIEFKDGKQVYNFIKDYQKNIKKGQINVDPAVTKGIVQGEQELSKSLTPEVTTDAENKIVELQELKEKTTAAAESLGKEYAPSAREQRLQGELLNIIDPVVSKVAENRTKALYDKIPAEQKENVSREDYRESLKSNLATMAVNEFTQGKQDLEAFIVNRGYLRANSLAKELGIESTEEFGGPGIISDITESAEVASETTPEAEVEVAKKAPAKKLKEVKETLNKENQTELKDVVAKLNLTEDQLTFKTLPNAAIEIFAKQIGIPAKKFDGKANFTRNELDKVIKFIEENVSTIRQALPEAAVAEGSPVSENLIGTATGVPNNLLKDFNLYTRQDRGTRLSGLIPYVKNKGIDNSSILKAIGNVDGRRMASPRDKQAQTAKGLINMLAKFATNQEVRKQKTLTPKQRSNVEVGKGSKLLYSFTTKGDGTWVPDLRNPLSGDKFYNFNVADTWFRISSFKNSGFNYDILEETFGIKEGAFANDINSKSIAFYDLDEDTTEITGKMGTKDSIKVFSIVANSIIDLIKKDNLNSVTFTAKEPSRQKLYEAMVQKFQKELGWESYDLDFNTPEGIDAAFVVYDPKFFINEETAVTTEKESGILYSLSKPDQDLLSDFGINAYPMKTNTDVDKYISDIKKLLKIFNTKDYKLLNSSVLQFTDKTIGSKKVADYLRAELKILKKSEIEDGKLAARVTEGRSKPGTFIGNTVAKFKNSIKSGKLAAYNKKHSEVFDKMWKDINQAIKENPDLAVPITYFLSNSINEATNPHRMGAPIIGFQENASKLYYEHAMQSTTAYRALLKAVLKDKNNKNASPTFDKEFIRVKKNYFIIAISPENNKRLDKAGYKNAFDDSWDNWWQRYFNPKVAAIDGGINPNSITFIGENGENNISFGEELGIDSKGNKFVGQERLSKSKSKAAFNNNKELPKAVRLPKDSTNEQVLNKMQELDNQANEERKQYSKSQDLDDDFNKIIEAKTGIKTYQRFDRAGATVKGASKGKFNFFIPPSAEDFVGLLYKTLAKGKVGDIQMQWFKDNLINPYARAMNDVSAARVAMFEDYKTLKNDLKIIPKDLKKKSFDEYTREQAVRVYIWDQQGNKIPGIFKTNQQSLVDYVNNNAELKAFADQLVAIQKGDQYSSPNEGWLAGSITTDLLDSVNSVKRKKYLEQWQTNVDEIFGETNMNKLEAAFGKPYREALTNILTRMKTGRNKPFTSDSLAGRFTNWLNNSVGAIMFFNTRSAVLQLLSSINFVNFTDNNPLKAGAAFANQPQYWKDFKFLFNSDFLKERRGGLRFNVSESEIADAAKKGGARGVVSKILQAGFLPTQMADSFAIATGGATFYRNRVKTYTKQGLTEAEANEKAFQDFRETAEESQQSSRPDRISAQQAGPLGRTILAFANTPAQYARLTKKAASDIINGRGDLKTNLSKLAYYGAVQNLIFNFLQQAVFALAFGDESDEEEKKKEEKLLGVANGMADSFLRGIGIAGAITATLKNALIKIIKEDQKARPDYAETTVIQLLGISPPVQSKAQKIRSALKSYEWNKDEMKEKGFSLDNPAYLAGANVISAGFNVPLDRVVKKVDNIKNSTQDDISTLNRIMLLAGWSDWQLDIQKEKPKKSKNSRVKIRKSSSRTGKRKVTTR